MRPYDPALQDIRVMMCTPGGYVPGVIRGRTYSKPILYTVRTDDGVYHNTTSVWLKPPKEEKPKIELIKGEVQ